jgi:hypothetical protein
MRTGSNPSQTHPFHWFHPQRSLQSSFCFTWTSFHQAVGLLVQKSLVCAGRWLHSEALGGPTKATKLSLSAVCGPAPSLRSTWLIISWICQIFFFPQRVVGWPNLQKESFSKRPNCFCGPQFALWTLAASLCQQNQL